MTGGDELESMFGLPLQTFAILMPQRRIVGTAEDVDARIAPGHAGDLALGRSSRRRLGRSAFCAGTHDEGWFSLDKEMGGDLLRRR